MKIKVVLLVLACCCSTLARTQDMSSIETAMKTVKNTSIDVSTRIDYCEKEYSDIQIHAENDSLFAEFVHIYASLLYAAERYPEAKQIFEKALYLKGELLSKDDFNYLRTTYMYGSTLYKNQELDSAQYYLTFTLDKGKKLLNSEGKHYLLFNTYTELALLFLDFSEYTNSLRYFDKAEFHFDALSSQNCNNKVRLFYLRSIVHIEQNNFEKAISLLQQAANLAQEICPEEYPNVANNLGMTYHKIGRYDLAKEAYLNASDTSSYKVSEENLYNIASNQVINYMKLGDYEDAENAYKEGLALAQKSEDNFIIAELYQHKAQLEETKNNSKQAMEYYDLSINTLASHKKRAYKLPVIENNVIVGKNRLINTLALKANALRGENLLNEAYETYKTLDTLITDVRQGHQTEEAKFFRIAEAVPIYEAAIATALQLQAQQRFTDVYLRQAFDFARRNKAALHYENIRLRVSLQDLSPALAKQENELRQEINQLEQSLADSTNAEQANRLSELREQYYQLIDEIKAKAPAYYDLKYAFSDLPSIEDIQASMPSDMAIVEYFFGENMLHIFVLSKSKPLQHYSIHDADEVRVTVEKFLNQDMKVSDLSYLLYQKLLKKTIDKLPGFITRLRIVPDDILYKLPFQVLDTKQETRPHYLIQDYALSYAISGKEHHFKRTYSNTNYDYIGCAMDYDNHPSLDYIPNTIKELKKSTIYYADTLLVINTKATKRNFLQHLGTSKIIHCPLHGHVNTDNVLNSEVVFADSPLLLHELYTRESSSINLTILSACDLGNGKLNKGEGLRNFIRAFQYAGAESVVSSLGKVHDAYAWKLMITFNQYIAEDYPLDKALQKATLQYLEHTDPVHTAPRHWAKFVLFGNPTVIQLD